MLGRESLTAGTLQTHTPRSSPVEWFSTLHKGVKGACLAAISQWEYLSSMEFPYFIIQGTHRWTRRMALRKVSLSKMLRFAADPTITSRLAHRMVRLLSSEASSEIASGKLRLWSDSGGQDVVSNPFDDFGSWHNADAKSFLHNISLDYVGLSTATGLRVTNEDRFKILELEPDLYYFAIFDGHGGPYAADFASLNLHERIKHLLKTEDDLEEVLLTAFKKCDNDLQRHFEWLIQTQGTI